MSEDFEIIGKIEVVETIAVGDRIREMPDCARPTDRVVGESSKALPRSPFRMVQSIALSFTGMKRTELAGKS
jgi:hypothetical protein